MNYHNSNKKKAAPASRKKTYSFSGIKLTEIEISIMEQLAKGLSDKETAEALPMQFYTLKTHLKRIYLKLNARNRTHAVMIYLKLRGRLIDIPEEK